MKHQNNQKINYKFMYVYISIYINNEMHDSLGKYNIKH